MSVFLDSTTMIYAVDRTAPVKRARALGWLNALIRSNLATISVQVMNEYFWVCSRKAHVERAAPQLRADLNVMSAIATAPLTPQTHFAAHGLYEATNYRWWDCLLLASAQAAGCTIFLSEDLQHEHRIGALTVIDPFQAAPADVLKA